MSFAQVFSQGSARLNDSSRDVGTLTMEQRLKMFGGDANDNSFVSNNSQAKRNNSVLVRKSPSRNNSILVNKQRSQINLATENSQTPDKSPSKSLLSIALTGGKERSPIDKSGDYRIVAKKAQSILDTQENAAAAEALAASIAATASA